MSDTDTLLVTGASGHLGQRVLHHLVNTLGVPAGRIIATTRKPATLADWAAKGVVVRASDFDDPASLVAAFEGASRVLLISTDTIGRRVAQHQAAIDAAVKVGATHVIYTSMPTPDKSLVLFAPDHAGTEAALAASALPGWTVLRNNWYFETLFLSMPSVARLGQVVHGGGRRPHRQHCPRRHRARGRRGAGRRRTRQGDLHAQRREGPHRCGDRRARQPGRRQADRSDSRDGRRPRPGHGRPRRPRAHGARRRVVRREHAPRVSSPT